MGWIVRNMAWVAMKKNRNKIKININTATRVWLHAPFLVGTIPMTR